MEYIHIYKSDETDFSKNGIAVLHEAEDICITREINGEYMLTFKYPIYSEKWKYIRNETICRFDNQLFRVRIISNGSISAKAVYTDACRRHIQYTEDMIGVTPREIMEELFRDTQVHIMTEAEVSALGMEWVTELTDFFEMSKITPIGGMKTLIEQLEEQKAVCELYVDNYSIALVKRLGKDNAGRITLRFNAASTESQCNSTELVTRLYPYGKSDLDISTVNGGKQYIDSPNIDKAGVYEGYMQFDDCTEPDELLELAKWQFSEKNPERIDVPAYNMEIKWADVSRAYKTKGLHKLSLGDRVKVRDEQTGELTEQRIIKTVIYPHQPSKSSIEVGQPKITFESFMGDLKRTAANYEFMTNDRYISKTSSLEMMRNNKRVSINSALKDKEIGLYRTGALFESEDGSCAIALIQGNLAIAKGKTGGEWNWTTVIDHNQVMVSEVFTGALYTDLCSVVSENGKLNIENSMITMYDSKNVLRFECGYNGSKYIFCLYDADGKKNVYIDDDGNAVFAGCINTDKDVTVGSRLYLQTTERAGSSAEPAVMFLNANGNIVGEIDCSEDGYIRIIPNGKALVGNNEIATKSDIQRLEDEIRKINSQAE